MRRCCWVGAVFAGVVGNGAGCDSSRYSVETQADAGTEASGAADGAGLDSGYVDTPLDGSGGGSGSDAAPDEEHGGDFRFGLPCDEDSECYPGVCLAATSVSLFGGGPARGMCTIECSTNPGACEAASPSFACVETGPSTGGTAAAFCFMSCVQGPPYQQDFDAKKCHGRHDMACTYLGEGAGVATAVCLPTCRNDSDCPSPRKCDPRSRVCVDFPHDGLPIGASCGVQTSVDAGAECAGVCLSPSNQQDADAMGLLNLGSFCSERCVLGDLESCGYPETPHRGVCLVATPVSGPGDEAFCA
ncbi:MAG: hypothetical protein HY898_06910 [Deltaproteobacteria bacterium]|nr:hypothetical protein [Deltaproteobacteria bacterium]